MDVTSKTAPTPHRFAFVLWCIYEHPKDYPEHFIARPWIVGPRSTRPIDDPHLLIVDKKLELVREKLPAGLTRIPRFVGDDPVIVETWV